MAIKTIHTHNIQSHKDVLIELPETGITAFTGNNSNGKSVIVKVTNAVISGSITKPKERKTLVNKDCVSGYVEYVKYNGMKLLVNIHHEAAQTFAELTYPDGKTVRRYLADKALAAIVEEFGFHYNAEHGVSLNVHNDDDKFLFVNTKHSTNYACLGNTLSDTYSEQAYMNLELVLTQLKSDLRDLTKNKIANQAVLDSLTTCNIEEVDKRRKKMLYIAVNLQHFPETPCPKVKGVPDVIVIDTPGAFPSIKYPPMLNLPTNFPDIVQQGRDVNDVLKGVCPTCKRAFFS